MSDVSSANVLPGGISSRNTDTRHYRVLRTLPIAGIAEVNGRFTSWPQGEVFANVSGVGLGPVKNSDIASWLESGMIEHLANAPGIAERRPSDGLKDVSGISTPENVSDASAVTRDGVSRPWTLPGAESPKAAG